MEENKKPTYTPKPIHTLFEIQVKKQPDRAALIYQAGEYSYRAINTKANRLANYIRRLSPEIRSPIAVCLEPSPELIIAILAILKTGNAYVPLDINYPSERLQFMLEDTKTPILITQANLLTQFKSSNVKYIDIHNTDVSHCSRENCDLRIDIDDNACIIYTSGSTGKPKGVLISHKNINNFNHWFSQATQISENDVYDFSSSISFDFSIATTLFPIINGAKIAICSEVARKDPYLYIRHLQEAHVTNIKITPSHFRQFKETVNNEYEFPDLHTIIFGGEALFKDDIKDWLAHFPHQKIINEYGPTEATVATAWIAINAENLENFSAAIPIGKPALNTQMYILDKNLNTVAVGEIGELYIGGTSVTKGYLNQPELTAERFIKNPIGPANEILYKTGDLCKFLRDGNIEFIGRIDHQIKIRGYRVEINEIEKQILNHPGIKATIVIAQENKNRSIEKQLVAYFIPKNLEQIPSVHEIHQFLKPYIPEYMIPSFFVALTEFPLTANGKLDRNALPDAVPISHSETIAPRNQLEKTLKSIWEEVLNIKNISTDDNFFELGGHSLSAARIISKIKKQCQKEIKLLDFYENPTIGKLANLLDKTQQVKDIEFSSYEQVDNNRIPLNDLQFTLWISKKTYLKSNALNIVNRKRVGGKIIAYKLKQALRRLIEQHSVLRYHVSPYFPTQHLQTSVKLLFESKDLQKLPSGEIEQALINSLKELQKFQAWKKGLSAILIRLFYLNNNVSEIQICVPHIVGDEISADIIFKELERYYQDSQSRETELDGVFQQAILQENEQASKTLERDMQFWSRYLKDVSPITFPSEMILSDKQIEQTSTSLYVELPKSELQQLQLNCAKNQISYPDLLCAIVGKSLEPYLGQRSPRDDKTFAFNFVKSTRDNDTYTKAIGLFIRPYFVKMRLTKGVDLITLAKQIQKSTALTAPYQLCSVIVKSAFLFQSGWKNLGFIEKMINPLAYLLSVPLSKFKLNRSIIALYGKIYLALKKESFMVQINFLNNFVTDDDEKVTALFGYPILQPECYREEKIVAKNIFDITFAKKTDGKFYLIVASNVKHVLLESVGKEIHKNILQFNGSTSNQLELVESSPKEQRNISYL